MWALLFTLMSVISPANPCQWQLASGKVGRKVEVTLSGCTPCFPAFRLYATSGEIVRSAFVDSVSVTEGSWAISLEGIPPGNYVLELECGALKKAFVLQRHVEAGEVLPSKFQTTPSVPGPK
ncbi:hypothetical protein GC167_09070 [bacterium]|nr:hypothetical protein [bacterium]